MFHLLELRKFYKHLLTHFLMNKHFWRQQARIIGNEDRRIR
jgi:hypothetical protein